ncbi:hypothetical protein ACFE04_023231 [Oxalis oulophora]
MFRSKRARDQHLLTHFKEDNHALSKKGKFARASQIHSRTTGATSFARKRDEFNVAKSNIFEKIANVEPSARVEPTRQVVIKKDVTLELMGPDKPVSARGHGIGVTKSKVSCFSLDLRRMGAEGSSTNHVSGLIRRINNQDQVITNQDKLMSNQAKQIPGNS